MHPIVATGETKGWRTVETTGCVQEVAARGLEEVQHMPGTLYICAGFLRPPLHQVRDPNSQEVDENV